MKKRMGMTEVDVRAHSLTGFCEEIAGGQCHKLVAYSSLGGGSVTHGQIAVDAVTGISRAVHHTPLTDY